MVTDSPAILRKWQLLPVPKILNMSPGALQVFHDFICGETLFF